MTKKAAMVLTALALQLGSFGARAGLIGATVDVTFYFPDMATLYCSNGSAVVGAGVEYPSS